MDKKRVECIITELQANGFAILENIFTDAEVESLSSIIDASVTSKDGEHRPTNLFAIRKFFQELPHAGDIVFNQHMDAIIDNIFGEDYFVVKSIYFDKPESSNWLVAYHQDLTISVNAKCDLNGYGPWTIKSDLFAVQPPLSILQDNFTIRIHLDDTNKRNGALKVVPSSHQKGVYRPETIDWQNETEAICDVKRGGVMIMKPLLLHASERSTEPSRRRVIHIEFSKSKLPSGINWGEYLTHRRHLDNVTHRHFPPCR